jgi:hypothetical protein
MKVERIIKLITDGKLDEAIQCFDAAIKIKEGRRERS